MKSLLFIPLLFLTVSLSAQTKKKSVHQDLIFKPLTAAPAPKATAVIKGNVKNFSDKYWELAVTGDLTNYSLTMPVDKDGNFNKTINIDDETEDIYLYLNDDAIKICAQKNDTILVNWDNKDFKNTFRVSSSQPRANARLQTMISVYNYCHERFMDLMKSLNADKFSDSVKYEKINNLYNKEMMIAATHLDQAESQKLITDVYYKYADLLNDHKLLSRYDLEIKDTSAVGKKLNRQFGPGTYRTESEYAYKNSNTYKQFIFNYVRFSRVLNGATIQGSDWDKKLLSLNPAWYEYYLIMGNFRLTEIRDWFLTREIKLAFGFYPFDDVSNVYNDFMTKIKTPRYADSLKQFYAAAQRLKPGNPAPDFSLKNDKGETVSLKSLRGKVVYIDFWGVGCAPCVYEIKNTTEPLHAKYKDKNVVFLNICVDSDEKTWKNNLTSLKMTGTNLIAEGWVRNPVCQKYNITGIPHYITIGSDGKIVNNNAARPSDGDRLTTELDKALK
ncbi:TlpA family protein disulfide reductase [Mucilaginibacter sp. HC2]|uniref:TlpA family protein disulfide reductase n=1 Tax=Mucilaginibacter inviolabilis TaxID=2714892 RepID=UPI00140B09D2|nr:TlpA disulfide reductase family protein [Mucilaginibacter inviolabilis]NHA03901.1 TlpA family protein disulfide reductase [Mucilaginibacter inviolabilis]